MVFLERNLVVCHLDSSLLRTPPASIPLLLVTSPLQSLCRIFLFQNPTLLHTRDGSTRIPAHTVAESPPPGPSDLVARGFHSDCLPACKYNPRPCSDLQLPRCPGGPAGVGRDSALCPAYRGQLLKMSLAPRCQRSVTIHLSEGNLEALLGLSHGNLSKAGGPQ